LDRGEIGEDDGAYRPGLVRVRRPVAAAPLFEQEVHPIGLEEVNRAEKRQRRRSWQILRPAAPLRTIRTIRRRRERRDIDLDRTVALADRARDETLRPALTLAGLRREAPSVVPTDERATFELALPEKRPLMWAKPLVGAKARRGANDDELTAGRTYRVRAFAREVEGYSSPFGRGHARKR
jgi:hypothetical protein